MTVVTMGMNATPKAKTATEATESLTAMKNKKCGKSVRVGGRPPRRTKKSISSRREDSEMWSKSVERPKEAEVSLAVEPFLVNEDLASQMLGISPRMVWDLGEQGYLRVKRVGRRKLYLVSSLKAYAESGLEVA